MKPTFIIAAALAIAACNDDAPPAPTAAQADQLNEADAMLDAEANNVAELD